MRCPYCKTAVESGVPSCLRCGMSLVKVTQLFGVVPRIVEGISDDAGILTDADKKRIRARANELAIKFPQTSFSLVTATLPQDTSLSVFAFWIFNEAGIAREFDRASNNYDILLTLDPGTGRCSLMVGYGLEALISEQQLEKILGAARANFDNQQFASATETVIANLSETLSEITDNLEQTHGIAPIVNAKSNTVASSPNEF